jgi:hypothetical protein
VAIDSFQLSGNSSSFRIELVSLYISEWNVLHPGCINTAWLWSVAGWLYLIAFLTVHSCKSNLKPAHILSSCNINLCFETQCEIQEFDPNHMKFIELNNLRLINNLKTKPVWFIQELSPYHVVNTLHFGYTKPIC